MTFAFLSTTSIHSTSYRKNTLKQFTTTPRRPRTFYSCQLSKTNSTKQSFSSAIKATLFSTGKRLYLEKSSTSVNQYQSSLTQYILCPSCHSAYVANALTSSQSVRCPNCTHVFEASPTLLYKATNFKSKNQSATKPPAYSSDIICNHIQTCPGCNVPKQVYNPPSLQPIISYLSKLGAPPPPIDSSQIQTHYWRTHAKLAVRFFSSSNTPTPTLGLFRSKSHELHPIPQCSVHDPQINEAVHIIQQVLKDGSYTIYNEVKHTGLIRYVLFTLHRVSKQVQITLVLNASNWKDASPFAARLYQDLCKRSNGKLFHSIWYNWNSAIGNAIVNPERVRWYHTYGERDLVENVLGVDIYFMPYAFRQANLDGFEKQILPTLLHYIPMKSCVAEFCAGVGIIGLVALKKRKLKALIASEIHDGGKEVFWKSIKRANVPSNVHVSYVVGSDSETIDIITAETNVIIVDPPRGGLSLDFVENIAHIDRDSHVSRLIYLSCGFDAFKKDAAILTNGDWKLVASHVFVLFPGSDHIETLAIFDRVRKKNRGPGRRIFKDRMR